MPSSGRIEFIYTVFSFIAAYYFTNGVFEKFCYEPMYKEDRFLLRFMRQHVDSRPVTKQQPRDEFYFPIEPWKVKQRMASDRFVCPNTTKLDPIKVVVVIKSAAGYGERRHSVRKTWGRISHLENMVIHQVFIVGMTSANTQSKIDDENARYGDILQYIGIDDYRHVAYKVLAGMQWAKENIPHDYFYATCDDDLVVNLTDLPKRLRMQMKLAKSTSPKTFSRSQQEIMFQVPILCVYSYIEYEQPERALEGLDAKYYMDPREYSMERLPPFCLGGFYMIPSERVAKLYDISRHQQALPMDDVWVTGILRLLLPGNQRSVDAIDASARGRRSGYVQHLRGDLDSKVEISGAVLDLWDQINGNLTRKKYCLRDQLQLD